MQRLDSIDFMRGAAVVCMTLDHTRMFTYSIPIGNPIQENLGLAVFFTRWITHLSAPTFVFLAGLSIFLQVHTSNNLKNVSSPMLKRGLFLVVLEFSLISWYWNLGVYHTYYLLDAQVIWAIGCGMIYLAVMTKIPINALFWLSLAIVAGHNLFDQMHSSSFIWSIFMEPSAHNITPNIKLTVSYPLLAWLGVIGLGYTAGKYFFDSLNPINLNKKRIFLLTLFLLSAGLLLRLYTSYGDPFTWQVHKQAALTVIDFLNVDKYPPSLDYLLFSLPLGFLLLVGVLHWPHLTKSWIGNAFVIFGRAPLFFYCTHFAFILMLNRLISFLLTHQWTRFQTQNLLIIWCMAVTVIALLYYPCKGFYAFKKAHRERFPFLAYL